MEQQHGFSLDGPALASEHRRLVRLCAYLTGRADVAEDLAQETIVEAWRQRHKLHEPSGQAQWLNAIARNICLRWRRRQAQELRTLMVEMDDGEGRSLEELYAEEADLEIDLERQELAELLDRALAALPTVTRQALVHQYVDELPQAEIAARLGMSAGAVAVRVHRGKLALRRVLTRDAMPADASYLPSVSAGAWEATRLWCCLCGSRRLLGRMSGNPVKIALRCPECDGLDRTQMECDVPNAAPSIGFGRAVSRVRTAVDLQYGLNRVHEEPACEGCGRPAFVHVGGADGLPRELQTPHVHVCMLCRACDTICHSTLEGIALSAPEARRFARRHTRVRAAPYQELTVEGHPAFLCRLESLADGAWLDVLVRRDSFRLIAVHSSPDA